MKLKSISIALALMLGVGTVAAADFTVGNLSSTGSFSSGVTSIAAGTTIDDNWLFSLSGGDNQVYGLITSLFMTKGIQGFGATISGPGGFSAGWDFFTDKPLQVGMFDGVLGSGNYILNITGTTVTKASYSVDLAAAPVPEPETYAMLLAGLGMLGFMARRRLS